MSSYTAVVIFITAWSNFLWPRVVLINETFQTMPMLISNPPSGYVTGYGMPMLAVPITSLPTTVIFLVLQRSFAAGITGAVK